ncbi:hypothetical protein ONS95_000583 [Cadophora gregata]|uniref:uncharacterized protein n=1 Tax=Cadophora gregata TaxID=51156 RepID=UPI0026DBA435|nr:uncharacterized protein ONS95_000583 [Cadophora gregata]KAK0125399.1 hypothetical protein ONS96_009245 [Cadophora gregata f. sp. sojae]KAK0128621.1 hypothetical protein ONS95_000583 [Cadophora gregata]
MMSLVKIGVSLTVCEPCKKRKKSCNKALPSCSRCSRLFAKCSYSGQGAVAAGRPSVLPPLHILSNSIPGLVVSASLPGSWDYPHGNAGHALTTDKQVSLQAHKLLNAISRKSGDINKFCNIYFGKFHHALPILNKEVFYWQLQNLPSDSHFSALVLAMYLISQMVSQSNSDEHRFDLYPTLKSIHSLLQSTGNVSHELIQAGILISSFEYCQALFQEAWITIGTCVRMAQILGLQESIRKPLSKDPDSPTMLETDRCIWWAIVIVERNINSAWKKSELPCAAAPPQLEDFLPLTPTGEDRLREDLILPQDLEVAWSTSGPLNRNFTKFGSFAATVQSTYLAGLVVRHVQDDSRDAPTRKNDAARLEGALQSYLCALIPPAGEAKGSYCGAFGIRTCMAYYFHDHEFEFASKTGDTIGASRARLAIQSMVRTSISMTRVGYTGSPIDFHGLAYWSHRLVPDTAMMHIKYGERDDDWQSGLDLMKFYLCGLEPRFKLYANYLRDIEGAEEAARMG